MIPNAKYNEAATMEEEGQYAQAAMLFSSISYKDSTERSLELWDKIADRKTIDAGESHTVGLKSDGTLVAVVNNRYGRCNVSGWTGIKLPR